MKKIIALLVSIILWENLFSQNVGIGTPTPHASAQLEISAANKGLLIPRMAQANRPASPATGLLIYQTNNTPGFYYYDGSIWKGLGGPWLANGNNIYNNNPGFVGVGTNVPNHPLHVHDNNSTDASIQLTNNWSGSGLNDGLRIRMYNEADVSLNNRENGDFAIVTNSGALGSVGFPIIWIKPTGAVGIGTFTPTAQLEVAGQVKITGGSPGAGKVLTSDATGLATWTTLAGGNQWTTSGNNIYNANTGSVGIGVNPSSFVQLHVRRAGGLSAAPAQELGAMYAENGNINTGSGVYGISGSSRGGAQGFAGVTGFNVLTGTDRFGVIGMSDGTSAVNAQSAGVGGYGDYGVLGYSLSNTGAGIIAQHGSGKTAMEINNGFIKVSGDNKTAFTVKGTAENAIGHVLILNYANQSASDIVIVTHNYNPGGVGNTLHNSAVGVYWAPSAWAIYSEDQATPMLGKSFNVIVIKQ